MHLYIRHPPLPDMHGLCYGRSDIDLPAHVFEAAARTLHPQLPNWPIVSSPARRCIGLARALIALDDPPRACAIDPCLHEMDFGAWERRPWSDIPRDALDAWSRDIANYRPPRGECFADLIARVGTALSALDVPHVVVTHAGVIRAAHAVRRGTPLPDAAAIDVPFLEPLPVP